MQRLALVLTLALLAVSSACSKPSTATAPTTPAGPTQPTITEAPISQDALVVFMKERFPAQVADGTLILDFGSEGVSNEVVNELAILGITTTGQLNRIIPLDFDTRGFGAIKASTSPTSNIAGLMRDIMIIHDAGAYVAKAWRHGWVASSPEEFPAPVAYGVDMSILENGGVFSGDGMEGDYDDGDVEGDGEDGYDPCAGDPCSD